MAHANKELAFHNEEKDKRAAESIIAITEQMRTEQALQESENYYRTIFENTGTAMMVIEEDITMSLVNAEAEKLFGCSREELYGRKIWAEFVVKDELERLEEHHRVRRMNPAGVPKVYEFNLINKQGAVLMEARILAVADVVEAMSSHRPYRPSLGMDLALEEILLNKGIRYDPTVVDICFRLFQEKGFKFK